MDLNRILIATDLSEEAEPALESGLRLAEQTGAGVLLLTVVPLADPLPIYPWFGRRSISEDLFGEIRDQAQSDLEGIAERVRSEHPQLANRVRCELANGRHVADAILEVVERESSDLTVLGTHGHRGWRRFVLGSVAEEVVRRAPGAVLTCPPVEAREELDEGGPVVVAVDLGPSTDALLEQAKELAVAVSLPLIAVHAVEPIPVSARAEGMEWLPTDDERVEAARKAMDDALAKLTDDQLEVSGEVLIGRASDQVNAFALGQHAQWLILGSRGLNGGALLLGSTADRILRTAPCPVLSLRF